MDRRQSTRGAHAMTTASPVPAAGIRRRSQWLEVNRIVQSRDYDSLLRVMSNITSKHVEIKVEDGTTMLAWVAEPAGQKATRGIMVFPEIFGVNAHIRDVTNRFAGLGLVAISPELFHRTAPPKWECSYTDFPSARGHMMATQEDTIESDVKATYNWLKTNTQAGDKIACVGYCMGGRVSFLANSAVPLKAAISYYGGNMPSLLHRTKKLSAPMLLFWGERSEEHTS